MHDGMPYGRNQGQGHSREVDRQSPTGLFFSFYCCVFALQRYSTNIPKNGHFKDEQFLFAGCLLCPGFGIVQYDWKQFKSEHCA